MSEFYEDRRLPTQSELDRTFERFFSAFKSEVFSQRDIIDSGIWSLLPPEITEKLSEVPTDSYGRNLLVVTIINVNRDFIKQRWLELMKRNLGK